MTSTRDYALLRCVLQSGFIAHEQLFEFMKLDCCERDRSAFDHRLLRLVRRGALIRRKLVLAGDVVYFLSGAGAAALGREGGGFERPNYANTRRTAYRLLYHSLDLNEIHLALKRTRALVHWMPETEVRARNDVSPDGYWKYYDAVVVVRLAGEDCKFALEYERTPKAPRRYAIVRERIEKETAIVHFLYVVPSYDLMFLLLDKLSPCTRPVYVTLLGDLLDQALEVGVRRVGSPVTVKLSSLLVAGNSGADGGRGWTVGGS